MVVTKHTNKEDKAQLRLDVKFIHILNVTCIK